MPNIIYLLGTPCAGKSTVLNKWEEEGGIVVPEFIEEVPEFVHNSWLGDEDTRLLAEQWAFEQNVRKNKIIAELAGKDNVLVERSPLDVLVYARAFGGKAQRWTENAIPNCNWVPGKLILLKSSFEVLKERWIAGRGLSQEQWDNQWLPLTAELYKQYLKLQKEFKIPEINTEISLEETMGLLRKSIEGGRTYQFEAMVANANRKEQRG